MFGIVPEWFRELALDAGDRGSASDAAYEVPRHLERLPNGDAVLVIGDPEHARDFNHPQGDNPFGFKGTCGLVSCEDILRQFDVAVSEADVVRHAIENGLCNTRGDNPGELGGTTISDQAQILTDLGVPASPERLDSLEDLANRIENGQGAIIEVDAGLLWNEPSAFGYGSPNHAIVVTGIGRDPETGEIVGVYINDSGRGWPEDSGRFLTTDEIDAAWLQPGGLCVTTDVVKTRSEL